MVNHVVQLQLYCMCDAVQKQPSLAKSLTDGSECCVLCCSVPNPARLGDGVCGTVCSAVPEAAPEQVAFHWSGTVHGEGGDSLIGIWRGS